MQRQSIIRLAKYASVSGTTFLLDLALLWVLIDIVGLGYVLAAALSFLVAVSVNYPLSRAFVFKGTLRSTHSGYAIFLGIAGTGVVLVSVLMFVVVEFTGAAPLVARVIVAAIVGMWNYLMNLYVNFKVAGIHEGSEATEVPTEQEAR
jgi:putative flippase GtrA